MKQYKKILCQLSIISFLFCQSVYAGISVQPFRFEGKVPAGRSCEEKFLITNTADKPIIVQITWTDRTVKPLKKDWIIFNKTEVPIKANKSSALKFKINIPENAQGEYIAKVSFQEKPPKGGMLAFTIRYNLPIYITVTGTEKYEFQVSDVSIENKTRTNLRVFVSNTGNVHIRPTGEIKIVSLSRDKKEYSMPFNRGKFVNIPEEAKYYDNTFNDNSSLPDGKYKAVITIKANSEENAKTLTKEIKFLIKGKTAKIL